VQEKAIEFNYKTSKSTRWGRKWS